jgi:hypothetical protein
MTTNNGKAGAHVQSFGFCFGRKILTLPGLKYGFEVI